jgi:hypothetical protein
MAEADCLGVLYGRKLISEDAFRAGRNYALLTALARRSWSLSEGSVNALWHRLISGTVEDIGTPRPVWADSSTDSIELARMALARRSITAPMTTGTERCGPEATQRRKSHR